ncbi:probable ATP-dependent DNA helicase HFM1 [Meriones unguiculatus]|uniref:probable ATP-dependent DNA helicase HFM1 n=1 Tax=Meriones unguiculatus TaxID=10047 RepID=UPI00293F7208|nr:probable ATP-dependent DNA helicase HFM1 [Meriones unguiculatus]
MPGDPAHRISDKVQFSTMLKSNDCFFPADDLFYSSPDETENFPVKQKPLHWFLPPAPLIAEIPDIQDLEEEIENYKLLGQGKFPKMVTSNLKMINEDKNCISPTQRFHFPCKAQKWDYLNLGGSSNSDMSHSAGKLVYDSSQKHKTHIGSESPPAKSGPGDIKLLNAAEDRGQGPSAFKRRLSRTCNSIHDYDRANEHLNLDSYDSPEKPAQTRVVSKEKSRNCNSAKQKLLHSVNKFKADDAFSASGIGENILKIPSFSFTSQPHDIQGITPNGLSCLKSVTEIPAKFRSIFKEFPYFNYIQSKAFDDLLYTDRNFVICAPTGSGKTVVFELAITRLLMEVPLPWSNIKIVYSLDCKEVTGDTVLDDLFEIQHADIILTTPEKWDSMTRKWRESFFVRLVRLVLIDEVHIIKDENRGPTLEVVVSRMKTLSRSLKNAVPVPVRFVAVSATIPNAEDIAEWLSDGKRPAGCLKMDESHRPVKLQKVVLGFPCSSSQTEFKFDLALNYKVYSVIRTYSNQKPTLVFCATRKGVQQAASVLVKDAKFVFTVDQKLRLQKAAYSVRDSKLKDFLQCGVGYHHAGMELSDRKLVEELFTSGDLPVLFTTSTLAMGVNLPAHLVVVKSTLHYTGGMFEEYSESDILQMIGRAGRPQFDTTATAVIMTRLSTREKYLQMLACNSTIESSLHRHLIEHLNAEVVMHTITDVNVALDWIRSTLLYIRALKNPSHYGFASGLNKDGIEAKLQELCLKNLKDLSSLDLIKMDEDVNFQPTEAGRLMAWYYITFETVKKFYTINGKETLSDLISMIASCSEFVDVQLRISEKRTLNSLNKDPKQITIRFPMEGRIKTREMKVNCLIQAQLGCIPIQDFTLTQDTAKIFRNGSRIARWLSDFVALQEKKFAVLLNSVVLAKCFKCKLWENSRHVSKQLDKIGISLSNTMVNAGLTSFKKIEEANARELELILSRHPPFGTQIKEAVMYLPKYELEVEQIARYSDIMAEILVTVILRNFKELQTKRTAPDSHYVTLVIGDADNQVVLKHKIMDSFLLKSGNWTKKIDVRRALICEDLSLNLISSDYVGLDIQQKFTVFYLGPRKLVSQTDMQRKLETGVSRPKYSARATAARSGEGVATGKKAGNRECNHHCKNKHACGHECCKTGVAQKPEVKESAMSSYLSDLKSRNAISSLPPVKRLKLQMNKSYFQNVDPKEIGSTPRPSHSSIARSEYLSIQGLPILGQWDQHGICGKVQQAPSEHRDKDFPGRHHYPGSNERTPQTAMLRRHADTPGNHSVAGNRKSSEVLNVSFELGDEVWDDIDEESLIEVMSSSADVEKTTGPGFGDTGGASLKRSKIAFQESSKYQGDPSNSFVSSREKPNVYVSDRAMSKCGPSPVAESPQQAGSASLVSLHERRQPTLSPVIERVCFTRSKKTPWSSKCQDMFI